MFKRYFHCRSTTAPSTLFPLANPLLTWLGDDIEEPGLAPGLFLTWQGPGSQPVLSPYLYLARVKILLSEKLPPARRVQVRAGSVVQNLYYDRQDLAAQLGLG